MIGFAAAHGGQLVLGLSLLMLLGIVAGWAQGSPARRHRWAEGVLLSVPVCAALLVVPMERALLHRTETSLGLAALSPPAAAYSAAGQRDEVAARGAAEALSPDAPLLAAAFAVGAALLLLYLATGALFLVHLLRGAHELPGTGSCSSTRIVVARGARRPFCIGTRRRGIVVLPLALAGAGREDQLEAVLAHERAHLEDGHGRARLLAAALAPVLYWNPLYWLLVARMRADAELCADDVAARALGKARYVRALLSLVESPPPQPRHAFPILGALAPARPFLERMESLMLRSQPIDRSVTPSRRATSVVLLLGAVALVNTACGTTAPGIGTGSVAVDRTVVPFETLDLDGTGLGEALAQGVATEAPFPERVQALAGKAVTIDGYMIPLAWDGDKVTEFLLMRDNLECCMGGPPTWGHWVYARASGDSAVEYQARRRVRVVGDFELVHPREWEPGEMGAGVYELRGWDVLPIDQP